MKSLSVAGLLCSLGAIVALLTFPACEGEVFEPDPADPRLPKYTEKGNEIGGALINDVAWRTNYRQYFAGASDAFFITNYADGDSLVIKLTGNLIEGPDSGAYVNLHFVVRNVQVTKVGDVTKLRDVLFTLDGTEQYGTVEDYDERLHPGKQYYGGGKGELHVKYIKELTNITIGSQDPYHPCIIAGTFWFSTATNASPSMVVDKGRFDFSFGKSNLILR